MKIQTISLQPYAGCNGYICIYMYSENVYFPTNWHQWMSFNEGQSGLAILALLCTHVSLGKANMVIAMSVQIY